MARRRRSDRSAANVIWVRIDTLARSHPKQIAAGPEACWLWACALMWANTQKSHDGFIPAAVLPTLFPFPSNVLPKLIAKLVDVGLFEARDQGAMQIHDYDHFQPSAEEMRRKSEARAEAGRRGGLRSGETRRRARSKDEAIASHDAEAIREHEASHAAKPDLDLDLDRGPISQGSKRALTLVRGMTIPTGCAEIFAESIRRRPRKLECSVVWKKFVNANAGRTFAHVDAVQGAWENWVDREHEEAGPATAKGRRVPRQDLGSAANADWARPRDYVQPVVAGAWKVPQDMP